MGDRKTAQEFLRKGEECARNTLDQKSVDHGYQLLASACYADPAWWEAFYKNGNVAADFERGHAAIACYRRALECQADAGQKAPLLTNLGWKLHELGRFEEALDCLHEATRIDPTLALAYVHMSAIHTALDQTETSVSCAMKAYQLDPHNPTTEFALGFALLFNRQFREGFKAFEARF